MPIFKRKLQEFSLNSKLSLITVISTSIGFFLAGLIFVLLENYVWHDFNSKAYSSIGQLLSQNINHFIVIVLIALVISYFISRKFLGVMSKPMLDLAKTMHQVANTGNYNLKINNDRNDELGTLIDQFNLMLEQIEIRTKKMNESEKNFQELQLYTQNIIDSMPNILIGLNDSFIVTKWNKTAESQTGIMVSDALAKNIFELLPTFHRFDIPIAMAIKKNKVQELKEENLFNKQASLHYQVTIYPLSSSEKSGAVLLIDDISEKVNFDHLLIQKEKILSIGMLAAGTAHEINNPLGVILQAIQNVELRINTSLNKNILAAKQANIQLEDLHEYLEIRNIKKYFQAIKEAGEKASDIVKHMLQFSRVGNGSTAPFSLEATLNKSIDLALNDYDLKNNYDFKHIEIKKNIEPNLPLYFGLEAEIEQVFINILKNAAQAMLEENSLNKEPQISIELTRNSYDIKIIITDNGPGMTLELQDKIFEPFFTTKESGKGTGLGLSVSHMIITNKHQGVFNVESEVGSGTSFIIKLPLL